MRSRHFRRAVDLKPEHADAWRALADHLAVIGDTWGADAARAQQIKASTHDPQLLEAAVALSKAASQSPKRCCARISRNISTDVAAIRMLAEVAGRLGRYDDAEALLERCLELAPGFFPARANYAFVLHREGKSAQALSEMDLLLAAEPRNPGYRNLKAAILSRIGEYDAGDRALRGRARGLARAAKVWMSYGHALKTAGRQDDAIEAYRKSIELAPHWARPTGAWPTSRPFRFTPGDVAAMRAQLARADLERGGPLPPRLRARQGARGRRRTTPTPSSTTRRAMRCAAQASTTMPTRPPTTCGARRRCSRAEFFAERARLGLRGARSDLHRRPAALRLDPARADPGQPSAGRRHAGAAGHHRDGAQARRPRRAATTPRSIPNAGGADARASCAPWARSTWSRPASSARPAGRSSSTRCRTTGRTSG